MTLDTVSSFCLDVLALFAELAAQPFMLFLLGICTLGCVIGIMFYLVGGR